MKTIKALHLFENYIIENNVYFYCISLSVVKCEVKKNVFWHVVDSLIVFSSVFFSFQFLEFPLQPTLKSVDVIGREQQQLSLKTKKF